MQLLGFNDIMKEINKSAKDYIICSYKLRKREQVTAKDIINHIIC